MSYEDRVEALTSLFEEKLQRLENPIEELMEVFAQEVELAYQAGYNRFNAITHECVKFEKSKGMEVRWHELREEFPLVGPDSQLPSIYSQSKGFKE